MESFVPLGGFFSMPPETKSPSSNACQYMVLCHLCNQKYEQEVAALSNGGLRASVAQQYQSNLPSWWQPSEPGTQNGLSSIKGTDDRLLLNAKIMGLQKKWDSICQQNHFSRTFSKGYNLQFSYEFPRVQGLQVAEGRKEKASNNCSDNSNELSNGQGNKNALSSLSTDVQKSSSLKELSSLDMLSKANNLSILSKAAEIPPDGLKSRHFDSLSVSINDGRTSPASVTSVTTDLGLGIISASTRGEPEKSADQSRLDRVQGLSGSLSTNVDTFTCCISNCPSQSSLSFYRDNQMHSDAKDPKLLYKALVERVGQQEEAISSIVETITPCQTKTSDHGVSNCIFLGATRFFEGSQSMSCGDESTKYTEEDIVSAKGSSIQILIRFDLNDDPTGENLRQSDATRKSDMFLMNKRKLVGRGRSTDLCGSLEVTKRAHKTSNSFLDLNIPAEGSEICNTISVESDSDSSSKNSRSWLEDFDRQIDQTVVFKPLDFETHAEKLFKNMTECLHNVVGSECSIEIEPKVMQQLLAAAYLFGNKKVEDWIQHVLSQGFVEAMGKYSLNSRSIVKLVTCDGAASEEQPEGLLPARIIMK